MNKNIIFQELIEKQRKNLILERKLSFSDIKRLSSYLNSSLFTLTCSLWTGYVTEIKNSSVFVNFFFNGKKQALHRILYYNFVDDISENEYLKYTCENKGKCCCINHLTKIKEKTIENNDIKDTNSDSETKNKKNITVEF